MKRTRFNPERRAWRGRSYHRRGTCVRELRDRAGYAKHTFDGVQ